MRIDERTEVLTPEGFLADIVANPADDTPRLIYADWLDEHNDSRGEFIRVQCDIARLQALGHTAWPFEKDPNHGECEQALSLDGCEECSLLIQLCRRERELLEAHGREWASAVLPWWSAAVLAGIHDRDYVLRRGFVALVSCTLADWFGQECLSCHGEGYLEVGGAVDEDGFPVGPCGKVDCHRCHGWCRIDAHGPALVRRVPLERVTLADREPNCTTAWATWSRADEQAFPVAFQRSKWWLPAQIFDLLKGGEILPSDQSYVMAWDIQRTRSWKSAQAALDALSGAALAWAWAQPLEVLS